MCGFVVCNLYTRTRKSHANYSATENKKLLTDKIFLQKQKAVVSGIYAILQKSHANDIIFQRAVVFELFFGSESVFVTL